MERTGLVRRVPAGTHVFHQGDPGSEMFVIQSGRVEIPKRIDERAIVLDTLGRGEFFGEMSVLESLPREADAVATDDVSLLVIGQGALLMRLRRDPTFALELLHALSQRIRRTTSDLVNRMGGAEP